MATERVRPRASRLRLLARQVFITALDLLFPPSCASCERIGFCLCERCIATMIPAPQRALAGLDAVVVGVNFEGAARAAIHALKYEGRTRVAGPLGDVLSQAVQEVAWPVDLVTAVPLHPNRLGERGYNQAALLGDVVALRNNWLFAPGVLARERDTASQVDLTAAERRENVAGAFVANGDLVRDRQVLVIDDVMTTGATLLACADALRAAGAHGVYAATLAGAVQSDAGVDAPGASI